MGSLFPEYSKSMLISCSVVPSNNGIRPRAATTSFSMAYYRSAPLRLRWPGNSQPTAERGLVVKTALGTIVGALALSLVACSGEDDVGKAGHAGAGTQPPVCGSPSLPLLPIG